MTMHELNPIPGAAEARAALSRPIWDLERELVRALEMLDEVPEGEPVPEYVAAMVEAAVANVREKRDALAGAYLRRVADAEALDKRAEDAKAKAMMAWRGIERFKTFLLSVIEASGDENADGLQYKIRRRANPPRVEVDETFNVELPDNAQLVRVKTTVTPDKAAIKDALQRGEKVPGARIVSNEYRVDIR